MANYFSISFSYKRKFRDKFRVFPEVFNEFSFSKLPESKVVYFSYGRIVGGGFRGVLLESYQSLPLFL